MSRLLAPSTAATSSLSFRWTACESLFCDRWIRKTIRNVTMVVPVLMTSCQVSEKPKIGPVTAQTRTTPSASPNAHELPAHAVTRPDIRSSHPLLFAMILSGCRSQWPASCGREMDSKPNAAIFFDAPGGGRGYTG